MTQMENNNNFFERYGLEVASGEVEVGGTYPIYGMITKFLDVSEEKVVVELNFSIQATMTIPDQTKINVLKERAFEPGIFVATVTSKEDSLVKVDCSTVVFGKKQSFHA